MVKKITFIIRRKLRRKLFIKKFLRPLILNPARTPRVKRINRESVFKPLKIALAMAQWYHS
jgi:hypothetical protein